MRQDGSWEGVYGRFQQPDGSLSGGEFRVTSTTVSRQFHPALFADSAGRFLAFWSSFVGGGNDFDLFAQVYTSNDFTPANPGPNRYGSPPADSGSSGGDPGSSGGGGEPSAGGSNKLDFPELPPGGIV